MFWWSAAGFVTGWMLCGALRRSPWMVAVAVAVPIGLTYTLVAARFSAESIVDCAVFWITVQGAWFAAQFSTAGDDLDLRAADRRPVSVTAPDWDSAGESRRSAPRSPA